MEWTASVNGVLNSLPSVGRKVAAEAANSKTGFGGGWLQPGDWRPEKQKAQHRCDLVPKDLVQHQKSYVIFQFAKKQHWHWRLDNGQSCPLLLPNFKVQKYMTRPVKNTACPLAGGSWWLYWECWFDNNDNDNYHYCYPCCAFALLWGHWMHDRLQGLICSYYYFDIHATNAILLYYYYIHLYSEISPKASIFVFFGL